NAQFNASTISPAGGGAAAPNVVPSSGTYRLAVVMMHLPGSTAEPISKATAADTVFGVRTAQRNTPSVADWYKEITGGALSVTGQVFGYYNSTLSAGNCDLGAWQNDATTAAAADGYVASNFDSIIVYTPADGACGYSGIGWVGGGGLRINGSLSTGVI